MRCSIRFLIHNYRKELELVVFVEVEFLQKKIQKEDIFVDLTHKLPADVVWNKMKPCESYNVIEKFDKVWS